MIKRALFISLSWLLLAAHFSRAENTLLMILSLAIPLLLLIKRKWSLLIVVILTIAGSFVWIETAIGFIKIRIQEGDDWIRLAIILFTVAIFTCFSGIYLNSRETRKIYSKR